MRPTPGADLRTAITLAGPPRLGSPTIRSPSVGEDKGGLAANLGVAMARAGQRTVVIDGDVRHPSQHRIFGVAADRGPTTLLTQPSHEWRTAAVDTRAPNPVPIPNGPNPPNPGDLLGLDRLGALMAEIGRDVNIVLVDAPPVLAVDDALAVAARADGVVLVCSAGATSIDALCSATSAFRLCAARVVGVVLDQRTGRRAEHHPSPNASGSRTRRRSDGTDHPFPTDPAAATSPHEGTIRRRP